ncbi:hypothetical protein XELAEV_18039777mg [Xenopus laevis]|uniref:Uncharacterized protein n=1 Tax=Xenopus laevis TaxID=8355 RepID=A0A974H8N6_XENLA|nr:hypothetical protein XELAEV_18039777mg [Xenopus laevis]
MFIKSGFLGVPNRESFALQKHWLADSINKFIENPYLLNIDLISQKLWPPSRTHKRSLKKVADKWSGYLQKEITPNQLSNSICKYNMIFTSENWRVQHFKLIHLGYGKMYKKITGSSSQYFCLKCTQLNVDLFHYLWSCPEVWLTLEKFLNLKHTSYQILSPDKALLHLHYSGSNLKITNNISKQCIV